MDFLKDSTRHYEVAHTESEGITKEQYTLGSIMSDSNCELKYSIVGVGVDKILDLKKGEAFSTKFRDSDGLIIVKRIK